MTIFLRFCILNQILFCVWWCTILFRVFSLLPKYLCTLRNSTLLVYPFLISSLDKKNLWKQRSHDKHRPLPHVFDHTTNFRHKIHHCQNTFTQNHFFFPDENFLHKLRCFWRLFTQDLRECCSGFLLRTYPHLSSWCCCDAKIICFP